MTPGGARANRGNSFCLGPAGAGGPGAVAEQGEGGGQQDAADDRGVDEDRGGGADAEDLQVDQRQRGEDGEDRRHDQRGARHHPGARRDAADDRLLRRRAARPQLADPAQDEHVVVHADPEQEHEHHQRHPVDDPAEPGVAEQALQPPVLEDQRDQAVGRADGQQVERDRHQRHGQRPERHEQQDEREHADEREHRGQA